MELLRKLRKERGLTLNDVSSAIGVTTSYISQIERGTKVPSLEILRSLSNYMGISPYLLLQSSTQPSIDGNAMLLRKEDRHPVAFGSDQHNLVESLIPNQEEHGMRVYLFTLEPGSTVSGKQVSHPYPEVAYVLSGTIEAHINDTVYQVNQEDSFYVAPMVLHDYYNSGSQKAQILFMLNE